MTGALYDEDPAVAAEALAARQEQALTGLLLTVNQQLVAAEAELIAGDEDEYLAVLARLAQYLDGEDRDLVAWALVRVMAGPAAETARRQMAGMSDALDLYLGATATARHAAEEPDVCPDPDGHARAYSGSELSWWRRSKGLREAKGECSYCGKATQ